MPYMSMVLVSFWLGGTPRYTLLIVCPLKDIGLASVFGNMSPAAINIGVQVSELMYFFISLWEKCPGVQLL